jgi:hypothetical protein
LEQHGGDDHGAVSREVLPQACLQLAQLHITHQAVLYETVDEVLGEIEQEAAPVMFGWIHIDERVN